MIFADLLFLYIFIPSVALLYALARCVDLSIQRRRAVKARTSRFALPKNPNHNTLENVVLIIFSLIFYAWGEPIYVALMVISVMINYVIGLLIANNRSHAKAMLILGLIINIGIIGVFKYTGLIIQTLNAVGLPIEDPKIALPIGISFFTFQSISYLIDVYRKESPVQTNFFNLLLYISMFPQLIAGPIVRYSTISAEIRRRDITFNDLSEGSFRFLVGLGKKVIFANELFDISSKFLDGDLASLSAGGAWLGLIAFTLQIYFDFSGYSDMAIGMGRCFGFHFNENFNFPYISKTITDFWRRWHISLGTFFRDYVYIPLGGNRRHQALNLLVVWFLTGLWHGASWNFVLWGVYFGIILLIEKFTIMKFVKNAPPVLMHIYSLVIIILGWALFYFEDFGRLGQFFTAAFGANGGWDYVTQNTLMSNIWLLIAAIVGCIPLSRAVERLYKHALTDGSNALAAAMTFCKAITACALLIISTLLLIGATNNAFLYTRF